MPYRTVAAWVAVFAGLAIVTPASRAASGAAGGGWHTVLLLPDGGVWTAGRNSQGALGVPGPDRRARVLAASNGVSVAAGGHTLIAQADGTLLAFGSNVAGALGLNLPDPSFDTPQTVTSLTDIVAVAAENNASFALRDDGTLWSFGNNASGRLGDGTTTNRYAPVQVTGVTDGIAVAAGVLHTLVLRQGGTVVSWGDNWHGQLGDNTNVAHLTAAPVTGLSGVVAIAAGAWHSVALMSSGTVYTWGQGLLGALGSGNTNSRWVPGTVPGLAGVTVTAIAAASDHTLALASDGRIWAWGNNGSGELGDGTRSRRLTAQLVPGLTNVTHIAAGGPRSFAFTSDGGVWMWGKNADGELGDGTTSDVLSPVQVAEAGGAWLVGAPTFSPAPGTYSTPQTVTVTSVTSGAAIHYTTTGVDPTETDPVVPGGGVVVDRSLTLKVRAWKSGMPPSRIIAGDYLLKVAQPTITPGDGTYTTAQSLTLASSSPGVTLRYTLDGSVPTESSLLYGNPLSITTRTTVTVKGFRADWDASLTRSALVQFNYGTLATPTASPAGGTYDTTQTVTLTGPAGAEIRYRLDGLEPGVSSPLYSAPLAITASSTLKAKSFHQDWTASPTRTEVYTLKVGTPAFSMTSGAYAPGQVVSVATTTPGATIRYTLNGATPTVNDPIWDPAVTLTLGNYTLKAAAWKTGYTVSDVATASYTLTGDLTAARIAAGQSFSTAVRPDGTVWASGLNTNGQLGDGTTTQRTTPVMVAGVTGVVSIGAGQAFSLTATQDGRVLAWGLNNWWQLGGGAASQQNLPVVLSGLPAIVQVAAGSLHGLAVTTTGQVYSWGANTNGQLGIGYASSKNTPSLVPGLANVVGVAAGENHSLAWTSSGALYAWGANGQGQLGDGSTTQRNSPVLIGTLTGVARVAAGRQHSLAMTTSGAVYAWGANGSGQVGDGTTTQRTAPTLLSGLTNVVDIAAGWAHSLAATQAGINYAWGDNAASQLGDGTTTPRSSPTAISGLPTIAKVAGGFNHSLALDDHDAAWTWGGNGNGQLGNGNTTTASTPGLISGDDMSWGVARPTFSPAPGTFTSSQQVIIATPTAGATIHYTTNGVDPTESDPTVASGGSVTIDQSLTLKAKAWKSGLSPSAVIAGTYVLKAAAPTINPAGGTYAAPQTITIETTTAGTTIRYTLDGSDPTAASMAYAAPVLVATTATLKAAAFKTGWEPSVVTSMDYVVVGDQEPPTITATVAPAPNAEGWNRASVTVSFVCNDTGSGIQTCPPAATVSNPTAGQTVSGTAVDNAGNAVTTSVLVKVDLAGPAINVQTPTAGTIVYASNVELTGTANDALSGLRAVSCNGVVAQVSGAAFSCQVGVSPGTNTVLVQAEDIAGNVASVSRTVLVGEPLEITPSRPTVGLGASMTLRLVNAQGQSVTGATWTVSNPSVVDLIAGDPASIRGIAAGQTTVIATTANGSAETTVTVAPTLEVPSGSVKWSAAPTPGASGGASVMAIARNDSGTGPDLFWAERSTAGVYVRAFGRDGSQLWRTRLADPSGPHGFRLINQVASDARGGPILVLASSSPSYPQTQAEDATIVRLDAGTGAEIWRYVLPDSSVYGKVAVHPDGLIVFQRLEVNIFGSFGWVSSLIALDEQTGALRFETPFAANSHQLASGGVCMGGTILSPSAGAQITIGGDGHVYLLRAVRTRVDTGDCLTQAQTQRDETLELMDIQVDGTVSSTTLYEDHYNGVFQASLPTVTPGPVLPGPISGQLATWRVSDSSGSHEWVSVVNGTVHTDYELPGATQLQVVGEGTTVFAGGSAVKAVDATTMTTIWSRPGAQASIVVATDDGGVFARTDEGELVHYDGTGTPTTISGPEFDTRAMSLSGDLIGMANGALTVKAAPNHEVAGSPWPWTDGNELQQRAPTTPTLVVKPESVRRGESFTPRVTGLSAAQITEWRFLPTDTGLSNIVRTSAQHLTWPGKLVTDGKLRVTYTRSGVSRQLERDVTVAARDWVMIHDDPAIQVPNGTNDFNLTDPPVRPVAPARAELGAAKYSFTSDYLFLDITDEGPNEGLSFVTNFDGMRFTIRYAIVAALTNTSSAFYTAQTGTYNPATNTGFISGAKLLENVRNHEAGAAPALSHYNQFLAALAVRTNNIGVLMEQQVGMNDTHLEARVTITFNDARERIRVAAAIEQTICNGEAERDSVAGCVFNGFINWP